MAISAHQVCAPTFTSSRFELEIVSKLEKKPPELDGMLDLLLVIETYSIRFVAVYEEF